MIGAIKRRWKSSKKSKVLHKGSELSTSSTDSCPTSRGFVDGCEDFEKMIKPPSPRQVHPVLEKGDIKYGHHNHPLHGQQTQQSQQQHPVRKKSSTLPSSDDGCHFIRVNSGRIELVSHKDSSPWKSGGSGCTNGIVGGGGEPFYNVGSNLLKTSNNARRQCSRGGRNDSRHSWCGSAMRELEVAAAGKKRNEGGGGVLFQEQVVSGDNNIPLLTPSSPSKTPPTAVSPPLPPKTSPSRLDGDMMQQSSSGGNVRVLLSPLKQRLAAIEEIAVNLQSWQVSEKVEYEKCVSDLTSQVSKAVSLQQLMRSEVEKLQQRVVDLENHNKAMATMIIPTLMKLHDTVGKENGSKSSGTQAECSSRMGGEGGGGGIKSTSEERMERKSPKHRKIDCRIPRMSFRQTRGGVSNSNQNQSLSPSPNPHNQSGGEEQLQQQQHQLNEISNESKSDCRPSPGSLSPSSKSESSSTTTTYTSHSNSNTNSRGSTMKNSGIPRPPIPPSSSPSTSCQGTSSSPSSLTSKSRKCDSPKNISHDLLPSPPPPHNSSSSNPNNSRLPIRKNLVTSSGTSNNSNHTSSNHHHKPSDCKNPSVKSANQGGKSGSNNLNKSLTASPPPSFISSRPTNRSPLTIMTSTSVCIDTAAAAAAIAKSTKTTGTKDEGYSTMSSEALTEQEKTELVTSSGISGLRIMPESGKSGGSKKSCGGGGGKIAMQMHKSNTFNTFREMDNYSSGGGGGGGTRARGKLIMTEPRNFTSLPTTRVPPPPPNSTPVMGRKSEVPPKIPPPTSSSHNNSSSNNLGKTICGNVKIVRGMPYQMDDGGETMSSTTEESSSTFMEKILFEDSDDSDILFLPLEMSSGSSSRSTLIPSCRESNGSPSSSSTTTGTGGRESGCCVGSKSSQGGEKGRHSKGSLIVGGLGIGGSGGCCGGEDRALIEKWMRLEDEWAWDWDGLKDGVQQQPPTTTTTQKSLRSIRETDADDDEEFWFPRSTHSTRDRDRVREEQPEEILELHYFPEDEVTTTQNNDSLGHPLCSVEETLPEKQGDIVSPPVQIDSSTWTKSKCGKIKAKLVLLEQDESFNSSSSNESKSLDKSTVPSVATGGGGIPTEGVGRNKKIGKKVVSPSSSTVPNANVNEPIHYSQMNEIKVEDGGDSHSPSSLINECLLLQSITKTNQDSSNGGDTIEMMEDGTPTPVIEFNPEFYHLVNYGSNISFSDNESNSNSPYHHPKNPSYSHNYSVEKSNSQMCQTGGGGDKDSSRLSSNSASSSSSTTMSGKLKTFHMDDKVSQTDFASSHENMSISSELFTECRNCLELIKKLVDDDNSASPSRVTTLDRKRAEDESDTGHPTNWLSLFPLPKGLATTEVDRILEILSSSESEDILSPTK